MSIMFSDDIERINNINSELLSYKRLWQSVLLRAMNDAVGVNGSRSDNEKRIIQDDAQKWFTDSRFKSDTGWVADASGLPPQYISLFAESVRQNDGTSMYKIARMIRESKKTT